MSSITVKEWVSIRLNPVYAIRNLDGNPKAIAGAYSMGIIIGLLPLVGVKVFMAVALAAAFRWNKLAAALGVMIINPLTAPFFFGLNFLVGKQIVGCTHPFNLPDKVSFEFFKNLFQNSTEILFTLFVGGIVTGILYALIAYPIVFHLIKRLKD